MSTRGDQAALAAENEIHLRLGRSLLDMLHPEHAHSWHEILLHVEHVTIPHAPAFVMGTTIVLQDGGRLPLVARPEILALSQELDALCREQSGKAWRGSDVSFGDFGLKALEPCWLTDRQIEAARVAMTRFIKRGGKIWVRVFPDKPITKKPQETRMGKGKGAPEQWVAVIKPGRVLFEMEGVTEIEARKAMRLAAAKLPILTKFATRFAQEKML